MSGRSGPPGAPQHFASLVELLRHRAAEQAGDRAFVFLDDRGVEVAALSFAALDARARAFAERLVADGERGDRAMLLFPPGLDFVVAFFACLYAGILAVPAMLPRRNSARDATGGIIADCAPRYVLTTAELLATRGDLAQRFADAGIACLTSDTGEA